MKKLYPKSTLCCLLMLFMFDLLAQDVITTKSGEDIKAKIMEVGLSDVKYKSFENPDGPVYSINKDELIMIRYENGSKDIFYEEDSPQKEQVEDINYQPENSFASFNTSNTEIYPPPVERTTELMIGGKAGYYVPYEEAMTEMYGAGFMWGAHAGLWIDKWGFSLDVKGYSKDGNPYTYGDVGSASSHISITPITLTGLYKFSDNGTLRTYGGAGFGGVLIKEDISVTANWGDTASGSEKLTKFEFHTTGGIRIDPLYFEVSFSSIPTEGLNFGGIIFGGGLMF